MKAVFVIISFTLLLVFLQTSAEESQDASLSREVRAADAGKKDAGATKGKKKCKGKKCQTKLRTKEKGKEKEKKKCKKGKNCKRRNKGKGRRAKGRKEKKEKRPRGRKGGKGKKGGKGTKVKGRKGTKGKGRKGTKGKGRKGTKGKGRKGKGGKGKKGKGGKGKRPRYNIEFNRKSERQSNATVPAKCTADECTESDHVSLFNEYKKNDNMLRQLQRLVRFYDLIRKKQASAATTFEPAAKAIEESTSVCTTCNDPSVSAAALGNCTILKNCSVSAPSVCNTNKITYGKVVSTCPGIQGEPCLAPTPNKELQCGDGCPPTTGPPKCTDVCKADPVNEPDLTEADKTFAENDCLPVLRNWTKQYRDCNAGDTFKCQQSGCNDKKGECNLLNCRCDTPKRTCDFEECVNAKSDTGKAYESYVCNTCLKKLKELLVIPSKCKTIAKYERAVFARKEECIRKDVKGSFGDCARSQKAIIPFISACQGIGGVAPTTVAPTARLSALKKQNMLKKFW